MSELVLERNSIPVNWEIVSVKTISKSVRDGTHNPPKRTAKGIPLLSARNIKNGHIDWEEDYSFIKEEDYDEISKNNLIEKKDVLLTIVGTIGRSCVVNTEKKFTVQRSVAIIKPRDIVNPEFIQYYFQSPKFQNELKNNSRGVAQIGVYLNTLKQFDFPISPLNEQKRIVTKIEELFSKIDYAIKSINKCVELLNILENSFVVLSLKGEVDILSKKITKSEIWQTKNLGDLTIESKNGYTGRPKDEPPGIRRLYIVSVTNNNSIYINEDIHKFIEIPKSQMPNYLVEKNDLLICRQNGNKNSVGKFSISRGKISPMIFSDSLIRFRVDQKEILPEYLAFYMNSMIGRKLIDPYCSTTAGNYSINSTSLKQIPIIYPSIDNQKLITVFILEKLSIIENLKATLVKYSEICHSLKNKILDNAFEGKLVPQDPNDEPAEILLQKIKQEKQKIISQAPKSRKKK